MLYIYHKIKKYFRFSVLILIPCLLIIIPGQVYGQESSSNILNKAPVVLDGQVLFKVGSFSQFSAEERAEQINQALIATIKYSDQPTIDLVRIDEQITLQDTNSKRHLLTVTQADVISAANPYHQALIWKNHLQKAVEQSKKERTTGYQSKALLQGFLITLIVIAIHLAIQFIRSFSSRRIVKISKQKTKFNSWRKLVIQWCQFLLLGLQLGIWIYAFIYITDLFPQTRSWRYWLNSPLVNFEQKSYSALELLLLLGLTVATWFIIRTITNLLKYYILKKTITESAVQDVIAICIQYIFTFLGLIILWQSWGIDVGALALTASVLGVGIGFGLQNITSNFISGLILTIERPIKVGDLIKVDDLIGTVKNIGARSTEILTQDHITIIVPNAQLLDNQLINWDHGNSLSRLRIPIGVSYNSELRKVKAALLYAAKNHQEVLRTPRPQVLLKKFSDSSLDFELLVWIVNPKKQFRITSDLNYLIMTSLRRYEIDVPFPQTDVNLNSPKLEQLLITWLGSQGINSHLLSENALTKQHNLTENSPHKLLDHHQATFLFNAFGEKLTEIDLEQLVTMMRSENGLKIADRHYHLNFYPACFVGSEAVDWIIEQQGCLREEAIELGQILIEREIIHHVTDEHAFQDAYLFYRFYTDE